MPVLLSHSEREARALRKLAQCRAQAWEKGWAPLPPRRQQVDPGGTEKAGPVQSSGLGKGVGSPDPEAAAGGPWGD